MNIFLRSNSPSPHEHVEDEEQNGKSPTARGICFVCEHMIFTIRLFHRFTNDFFFNSKEMHFTLLSAGGSMEELKDACPLLDC